MMRVSSFGKKASSVIALLVILWLITDDTFTIYGALKNHEPSLRIFRSLLEIVLGFLCVAISLQMWSGTPEIAKYDLVGFLLFQPVDPALQTNEPVGQAYESVAAYSDEVLDEDEEEGGVEKKTEKQKILSEEEALDAQYDSDGEVQDPVVNEDAMLTPTYAEVWGAGLDLFAIVLLGLFLYAVAAAGFFDTDNYFRFLARIAAPTFPLLVFVFLAFRSVLPWKRRKPFWHIIYLTLAAPWTPVTFRDGFVGDILTSSVRPMQDLAFTLFYLFFGLHQWWSQDQFGRSEDAASFLDRADAQVPEMEKSWLLHTVVLPMCMVSPLWWRFMQNLRQCYEARKRWPYLGNALKYFVAAQVAMFGVFQPGSKKSSIWLGCFVGATLYQIWWDVFMDWGLLEKNPTTGVWGLRQRRLYSKTSTYYSIAIINVVLRFCWTLSFIPPRYLNAAGVLEDNFYGDLSLLGPFIACAEIIRRTLWGWLRLEWEAIKVGPSSEKEREEEDKGLELTPMKLGQDGGVVTISKRIPLTKDMSSMNEIQVLGELSLYATAFATLGLVAAAHRGTQ